MRLHPIATPWQRPGQEVTDHLSGLSTTLRGRDKAAAPSFCVVRHIPPNEIDADLWPLSVGIEGNHGHSRSATVARPFISDCFSLASPCGSVATLHSHPRHGAIAWVDRHAGLGRIGFGRSNVKSAVAQILSRCAAIIRQSTKQPAKDLQRWLKLSQRPRHMETNRFACTVPNIPPVRRDEKGRAGPALGGA